MMLAEALLASVILATTVVFVSAAFMAGTQQSYEAVYSRRAAELAEAMVEEIIALPYVDPDGLPEAGRNSFDNVADYHGYAEAAGNLIDANGNAYPTEYDRYARSVTVTASNLQPPGFASAIPGVKATVTVTLNGRTMVAVSRFVPAPPP